MQIKNKLGKVRVQSGLASPFAAECIRGLLILGQSMDTCATTFHRERGKRKALLVVAFWRVDYIIIFPLATSPKTHTRKSNTLHKNKNSV